jgi:3-oxoacyl-[acyl-carrier protein] reductase
VTGGSRGIGAACCRLFARAGAAVTVHYGERHDAADSLLAELDRPATGSHLSLGADLAVPHEIDRLFEQLEGEWGGLDCLVNNAGVWRRNPLATLDVEELENSWRINLRGVFLCGRRALPLLDGSADGNMINISSTAGQRGEAFYSPYAASKGAIIALTKSWSTELAPEIRVNAVAPGWVDTEMCIEPFAGGGREAIESTIPLGRVASPEDVAGSVLFLASPLARHITGEIVNVNGGSVLAG